MSLSTEQFSAIISLPGAERYQHFVKVVADREEVWGLYKEGWALSETEGQRRVFPVWPRREYAEACAEGDWRMYEPSSISVYEFLDECVPKLVEDGVEIGVFYTPANKGVIPPLDQVVSDIKLELDKY